MHQVEQHDHDRLAAFQVPIGEARGTFCQTPAHRSTRQSHATQAPRHRMPQISPVQPGLKVVAYRSGHPSKPWPIVLRSANTLISIMISICKRVSAVVTARPLQLRCSDACICVAAMHAYALQRCRSDDGDSLPPAIRTSEMRASPACSLLTTACWQSTA